MIALTTKGIPVLQNYIGGKWVNSRSDDREAVPNPATGELLAYVPLSNAEDVDAGVEFYTRKKMITARY